MPSLSGATPSRSLSTDMPYDIFISYSRRDNTNNLVSTRLPLFKEKLTLRDTKTS